MAICLNYLLRQSNVEMKNHDLLSKRSKQTKAKKGRLKKDLYDFFDKLDNDYWNIEINKLINKNEEYFSSNRNNRHQYRLCIQ